MKKTALIFVIIIYSLFLCLQPVQADDSQDESSVSVVAVGDVMFHMSQLKASYNGTTYDLKPPFDPVRQLISEADIAFCNFETVVYPKRKLSGYPSFNSPVQSIEAIKYAGFDVVSLANNHSLDMGVEGLAATRKLVAENGLIPIGINDNQRGSCIIEKNDIKMGFLSYSEFTNRKGNSGKYVNLLDLKQVETDIKMMKKKCDFLVVYLHAGIEYKRTVSERETKLYRKIAELGADCVISSHPHVARKTELWPVKDKKVLINYSMGNFISNQNDKYTDVGSMLKITVNKSKLKTELERFEIIPCYRYRHTQDSKLKYEVIACRDWKKYGQISQSVGSYLDQVSKELTYISRK